MDRVAIARGGRYTVHRPPWRTIGHTISERVGLAAMLAGVGAGTFAAAQAGWLS